MGRREIAFPRHWADGVFLHLLSKNTQGEIIRGCFCFYPPLVKDEQGGGLHNLGVFFLLFFFDSTLGAGVHLLTTDFLFTALQVCSE
jgi:hypothetical protein